MIGRRMREARQMAFAALIAVTIGSVPYGCSDMVAIPSDIAQNPTDVCPWWDTDCDNISNAVETNGANSYLSLDPDSANPNPSIAHGGPYDGSIGNALNLVNSGPGYYHYINTDPLDSDDWGVLAMINMIEGAERQWLENRHSPPRIGIGDISWGDPSTQVFGGQFPDNDHASHENGLDVDARYIRNDGLDTTLNLLTQFALYDASATVQAIQSLFDNGDCVKIYVSQYSGLIFENIDALFDSTGAHDNHFHLRIQDPDGTNN